MSRLFTLTAAGVLLGLTSLHAKKHPELERVTPVAADQPIPLIDYCRPSLFETPYLNRSGTRFAAVVNTDDDYHAVILYDVAKNQFEKIGGDRSSNVFDHYWLTDDRILLWSGFKNSADYQIMVGNLDAKGLDLSLVAHSSYMEVIGAPEARPHHPIMDVVGGYMDGDSVYRSAVVLNTNNRLKTGGDRWEAFSSKDSPYGVAATVDDSFPKPPGDNVGAYISDTTGELAYASSNTKGVSSLYRWDGKKWNLTPVLLDELRFIGVDVDPNRILVTERSFGGKHRSIRYCDTRTGVLDTPLVEDERYDLDYAFVYRDKTTKRALGIFYDRAGPAVLWVDPGYKEIQAALDKMFPGERVRIHGSDLEHKRFILEVYSDRNPGVFNLVDLEARKVSPIKSRKPWIDPKRMLPMQIMGYKSRDGHKIEGYLTLPAGASKTNPAPLLVLPHGGPYVRDTWGYDSEVQLLAHEGYAVFQPNYRGSTGYQSDFKEAEIFDFRRMSDDVTDGVKALLKSGLVDPKRVGIMGGSFGGYLAVSGVAFERGLYRCAVTMAGVFDWKQMIKDASRNNDLGSQAAWMKKHIGDPKTEGERFEAMSPLHHLEGVSVPIFVTHGRDDRTVPIGQSKELISELDRLKIPFEKYFIFDEVHGLTVIDHRLEFYKRILAFLDKNLKNAP